MLKYIVKRIINLIPVVFVISIILFAMIKAMPGDPVLAMMPQGLKTAEQRQVVYNKIKSEMGYDRPNHQQYVMWLGRIVKGDLGFSTSYKKPVSAVIAEPLRNTFILNIGVTIISLLLSIFIGISSAVRKGSFYDKAWQVFSLIGISLPTFFIGLTLIFIFALKLGWLPANGMPILVDKQGVEVLIAWLRTLTLPTVTLVIGSLASTSRYVRTSMIDALSQDYVKTARSKGLSEKTVVYAHAFRNALIPVVTVVAWAIVGMFGGAAITETIFAYNGIGNQTIKAVLAQDYNLVMGINMFYAILMVVGNLLQDIGYAAADPRVRLE
ncbi:MAG: ABC transporter permease [Tissierellia bacterium]|nr:ABC transporter permease [Tissierellia bacterium]